MAPTNCVGSPKLKQPEVWRKALILITTIGFSVSCNNPFSGDCISLGVAGLTIIVIEAGTNRAPDAAPRVRVTDGEYAEDYVTPYPSSDPPTFLAALERPGTYRVLVQADGYQDYTRAGISVVRSGRCNYLSGVRLTVPMTRL